MPEAIHRMNKSGGLTKCGQKVEGKLVSIWPAGVTCKECLARTTPRAR